LSPVFFLPEVAHPERDSAFERGLCSDSAGCHWRGDSRLGDDARALASRWLQARDSPPAGDEGSVRFRHRYLPV